MRCILPLAFATFALMIGNAALATVNRMMEAEAEEICLRDPICSGDPRYVSSAR
jgi:hypothetical protein